MNWEAMMNEVFKDCEVKRGIGSHDAPIAVIYGEPGAKDLFPSSYYLEEICKQYELDTSLFYITPVIKDRKNKKPMVKYADFLINELSVVKPKMAWILGQEPLALLNTKDVQKFYRHTFGMFLPFLIRDFYGLLVVGEKELGFMPDSIKMTFHKRMTEATDKIKKHGEGFFKPEDESRADLHMIDLMTNHTKLKNDPSLSDENSFFLMWSDKVQDHIFLCTTPETKTELLKLGFGLVFTKDEVGKLSREDADFVALSLKTMRARKVEMRDK